MAEFEDYYEILQVSPYARLEIIQVAYKRLMKKYDKDPSAAERIVKIQKAYEVLSDPVKRKAFHKRWLAENTTPLESSPIETLPKPKPVVKPSRIRFSEMEPGKIKTTTFEIANNGGPYKVLWFSRPYSWLRIKSSESRSKYNELPIDIVIEATGTNWGEHKSENIRVKLDEEEIIVNIELQMKEKPKESVKEPLPKQPPEQPKKPPRTINDKKWITTILLSFFLGILGADRYYLRQFKWASWKLFTIGGAGLWWLSDVVYFIVNKKNILNIQNNKGFIKYSKSIGIATSIVVALSIAGSIITLPPPPPPTPSTEPQQQLTINIYPNMGIIGTEFNVTCIGLTPSNSIAVEIISQSIIRTSKILNSTSEGTVKFTISTVGAGPGNYLCQITDVSSGKSGSCNYELSEIIPPTPSTSSFSDDFDNSDSGWEIISDQHFESKYDNGKYGVKIRDTDNPFVSLNKKAGDWDDFIAIVDILQSGSHYPKSMDRGYQAGGLVFRNEYIFWVSRFGLYGLYKGTDLAIINFINSSHIKTGPNTNSLKVICKGNQIKLYVNDIELNTVTDLSINKGYLGLAAQGNNSSLLFDNFKIYLSQ